MTDEQPVVPAAHHSLAAEEALWLRKNSPSELLVRPAGRPAVTLLVETSGLQSDGPLLADLDRYLTRRRNNPPRILPWIAGPLTRSRHPASRQLITFTSRHGPHLYLDRSDEEDRKFYEQLRPDIVLILSPHVAQAEGLQRHLGRARALLVATPPARDLLELLRADRAEPGRPGGLTHLYLFDLYRLWAATLKQAQNGITVLGQATEWLDGRLAHSHFYLVQDNHLGADAPASTILEPALTHYLALLAYFARPSTLNTLQLQEHTYPGTANRNTTIYAHVAFTMEDFSGNGWRVPCEACVGQAADAHTALFEIAGGNGRRLLIAFPGNQWPLPFATQVTRPGLYFLDDRGKVATMFPLSRSLFAPLLTPLLHNQGTVPSSLPFPAVPAIATFLDRYRQAYRAIPRTAAAADVPTCLPENLLG